MGRNTPDFCLFRFLLCDIHTGFSTLRYQVWLGIHPFLLLNPFTGADGKINGTTADYE